MRAATEKKVNDIRNRAKSMKASFIEEVRALEDPEATPRDKMIPRVSAIVIREGLFLVKIAKKFLKKHNLKLDEKQKTAIADAEIMFEDLADTYSEDLRKNDFIYRLPVEVIIHLQTLSAMIVSFDADVKAKIAKLEFDDAADDAKLDREIAALEGHDGQSDEELEQEINSEMIGG